jgi:hypothetical protein
MIVEGCGCRMVEIPCCNRGLEGREAGRKEVIGVIVQLKEGGCMGVLGKG